MNINELIKTAMLSYMKETDSEKKANAKKSLDTLKLVKTAFMEYVTNKTNAKQFEESDDVSVRITKINDETQTKIIEDLISIRKKNIETYKSAGRDDLASGESFEMETLDALLPKVATEDDITEFLKKNYPDGIEQKQMGNVIKEIKSNFLRVDGKITADCVKAIIRKN